MIKLFGEEPSKMKHIIPILVILLLLLSGFVGVSNTAEEQWVDAEQKSTDEGYAYNRFYENYYQEGYFSRQYLINEYNNISSEELIKHKEKIVQLLEPAAGGGEVPLDFGFMEMIRINLTSIIDNETYWRGKQFGTPGERLAANNLKSIWDNHIAADRDYIENATLDEVGSENKPSLDDYNGTENISDFKLIISGINNNSVVIKYPECSPIHTKDVKNHEFQNAEIHITPDNWYSAFNFIHCESSTFSGETTSIESIGELNLENGMYPKGNLLEDKSISSMSNEIDHELNALESNSNNDFHIYLIENEKLFEHTYSFGRFVKFLFALTIANPLDDYPKADAFILADVNDDMHFDSNAQLIIPGMVINGSLGKIIKSNIINNGEGTVTAYFKVKTTYFKDVLSWNVVGTINGTVEDIVIIGSHYDTMWGPCAADDAGSNSVVWGVAKYYADNDIVPYYTLKFIAWAGEEFGCRGSRSYINKYRCQENWRYVITLGALGWKNHSDVPKIDTKLNVWKIFKPGCKPYGFDDLIKSIDYPAMSGGYGGIEINGEKPSDMKQIFLTDGGMFFLKTNGIITIDKGTPDIATHWHHRDGENHTKGNTLDIIDDEDINASAEVVLSIVKHINEKGIIHMFCFVESGDVRHDNVSHKGIFLGFPPGLGVGRAHLDLLGGIGETRLKVRNIFGTKIYDRNVSVSLRGFIGCIYPTVSIYGGILKGFSLITIVNFY